jgi:FeS assembly SUF system protein
MNTERQPTLPDLVLEQQVIEALHGVYDPEIPLNLYDLGLIYRIETDARARRVHIEMTLTAPACPVAHEMPERVACAVRALADVDDVTVELVWEPPWDRSRMSEAARLQLGLV